jgi:hypothetical protein
MHRNTCAQGAESPSAFSPPLAALVATHFSPTLCNSHLCGLSGVHALPQPRHTAGAGLVLAGGALEPALRADRHSARARRLAPLK